MSDPEMHGPPPEFIAAMVSAIVGKQGDPGEERMRVRDTRNQVFEFIESLDVQQLRILRLLLHVNRKGRAYIDGLVAWELRHRNVDPDGEEIVPDKLPGAGA